MSVMDGNETITAWMFPYSARRTWVAQPWYLDVRKKCILLRNKKWDANWHKVRRTAGRGMVK